MERARWTRQTGNSGSQVSVQNGATLNLLKFALYLSLRARLRKVTYTAFRELQNSMICGIGS